MHLQYARKIILTFWLIEYISIYMKIDKKSGFFVYDDLCDLEDRTRYDKRGK